LVSGRHRKLQQFSERDRSGVVHGRAHGHLDCLQIQTPRFAAGTEDDTQQLGYFARDLPLDRFGPFFSWSVGGSSSVGRE
jgi:hypothetical protein